MMLNYGFAMPKQEATSGIKVEVQVQVQVEVEVQAEEKRSFATETNYGREDQYNPVIHKHS